MHPRASERSYIATSPTSSKGFEVRVVTPPGGVTVESQREKAATVTELHAEELRAICNRTRLLGDCAARMDVSLLNNEHIPSLNKVETYRVVCSRFCDSDLPKADPVEQPVEITQAS